MEKRPLWKQLLFPPLWVVGLLTIGSAAALPLIFLRGLSDTPVAYAVFAMAFYTVCIVTAYGFVVLPRQYRQLRGWVDAHPVGHRYLTDAAFRTHVSLYASLTVNLLYAAMNLLFWHVYRSAWFVVLASYYGILSVMRFLLVRYTYAHPLGKDRWGELRRARLCSYILLLVNFVLSGAVLMILYQDKGFDYHGVLIYAMAAYTFYMVIHAIVSLVRYRKYRSPVMTTAKVISLSAALVSLLSLETAMLSRFGGEMTPESRWLLIALTGAGVSLVVVVLSVYRIIRTAQEIKEITRIGREKRDF